MQTTRTTVPIEWITVSAQEASLLKVTIVYDALPAGQNALHSLALIRRNFEGHFHLRPQLWRTDLLNDPDWFGLALSDGIEADILMIAAQKVSGPLKGWIEQCVSRKSGTIAAVVALLDKGPAGGSGNELDLHFLRYAAKNAGLDFFSHGLSPSHSPGDLSLGFQMERGDSSARVGHSCEFSCDLHWGINE